MTDFEAAKQKYIASWCGGPSITRLQGWEDGWRAAQQANVSGGGKMGYCPGDNCIGCQYCGYNKQNREVSK